MTGDVVLTRWETERSTHEIAVRAAGVPAAAAVDGYVGYEEWPARSMSRREVARSGIALILAFGDPLDVVTEGTHHGALGAFVVGNQSGASMTTLAGHQHGVQVELSAAGALALLGDVAALNDAVVPIDQALGPWGANLIDHLGNSTTWESRFAALDHAFSGLVDDAASARRLTPDVRWLRRQLVASGGQARVEPLMDETGWSRRVVTHRFRHQLGVTPKAFARILRFNRAVALLTTGEGGRSLADVAIACGYYDQSHFTREFVALAGCTPTAFLAEGRESSDVRFVQDGEDPGFVR